MRWPRWRRSRRTWQCAICGATHRGLASVFGATYPDAFLEASPEVLARSEANADTAVLEADEGPRYFVRGHVVIPVDDAEMPEFVWSVWVELTEEGIDEVGQRWDRKDRATLPPVPARLDAPSLPYEPPIIGLRAVLRDREPGTVPLVLLDESQEHPLVTEQRDGITIHRVADLNTRLLAG